MIAMTTSNSIRVKPDLFRFIGSLRLCIGSSSPGAWIPRGSVPVLKCNPGEVNSGFWLWDRSLRLGTLPCRPAGVRRYRPGNEFPRAMGPSPPSPWFTGLNGRNHPRPSSRRDAAVGIGFRFHRPSGSDTCLQGCKKQPYVVISVGGFWLDAWPPIFTPFARRKPHFSRLHPPGNGVIHYPISVLHTANKIGKGTTCKSVKTTKTITKKPLEDRRCGTKDVHAVRRPVTQGYPCSL